MPSVRPLRSIVDTVLSRDLSPQARQRYAANFARARLAEGIEQNRKATGREVPYEQIVDGRLGATLESVNPDRGRIIFRFDVASNELFVWIADTLVRHAPRLTGRYADSFRLFAGGREIDAGETLPKADEYVFLNVQPYARRIEGGWSSQAPDGVFQAVAALAKLRYGDVAFVKFSYRAFDQFGIKPYVPRGRRSAITRGERGRFAKGSAVRIDDLADAAKAERAARTPAIIVSLR